MMPKVNAVTCRSPNRLNGQAKLTVARAPIKLETMIKLGAVIICEAPSTKRQPREAPARSLAYNLPMGSFCLVKTAVIAIPEQQNGSKQAMVSWIRLRIFWVVISVTMGKRVRKKRLHGVIMANARQALAMLWSNFLRRKPVWL